VRISPDPAALSGSGLKVTKISSGSTPTEGRNSVQCEAVRKSSGEISVPEQSSSRPGESGSQSANRTPTLGCLLPSSCPKVMAPADGARTRDAATAASSTSFFIRPT